MEQLFPRLLFQPHPQQCPLPHLSFSQYSFFYISCISPVHSHVSFCGSFRVSSCVSCPCWLSPFPEYIWVKVTCAPLTGWGFDGLIVIFIQFGGGWNWLWLAQSCLWHPFIPITPAGPYCWSRMVFCLSVQPPSFLYLIWHTMHIIFSIKFIVAGWESI